MKPAKKNLPKPIINLKALDEDMKYCVEYDYDRSACTGCTDYCRCTTISNIRVTDVNSESIANKLTDKKNEFLFYAVERVLRHSGVMDPESWDCVSCGGYYGDEVGSIKLDGEAKHAVLAYLLRLVNDWSPKNCISVALVAEYGYLLDCVVMASSWRIGKVDIDAVLMPETTGYQRLDRRRVKAYTGTDLPLAVVIKEGDNYRLIDGRHRFLANKEGHRKAKVVIGE